MNVTRKRLVFLAQLPPPVHGASLMNQYVASAEWLQSDYELILIALQFASSVGDIGRARLSKLGKVLEVWGALVRTCVVRRPSAAYFTLAPTGPAFWRDLTFVVILKAFRVPLIFHIHGKGLGPDAAPRLQRACYRWVFRDAIVIQLSAGLYRELEDIVPKSHSRIVANGIPDISEGSPVENRPGRGGCTRILFLSNMHPEKGMFEVLEAVAMLRGTGLSVAATFVGPFLSTSVQDRFSRMASSLEVQDCVRWEGPAYGADRYRYFAAADIFAFPSYYGPEAFPLAILEAMAAGLPVVGARTGAIPEIIDDGRTGVVVPPRDPRALAAALAMLVRDSAVRLRMGEAGRVKYEREYRLDRFLREIREIFAECTGMRIRGYDVNWSSTCGTSPVGQDVPTRRIEGGR